jgi:hypothetical protein
MHVPWRPERAYLVLINIWAMSTSHYQRLPRTMTLTSTSILLKGRAPFYVCTLFYDSSTLILRASMASGFVPICRWLRAWPLGVRKNS